MHLFVYKNMILRGISKNNVKRKLKEYTKEFKEYIEAKEYD